MRAPTEFSGRTGVERLYRPDTRGEHIAPAGQNGVIVRLPGQATGGTVTFRSEQGTPVEVIVPAATAG